MTEVSLGLSIAAIVVAIWQGVLTRKHNRVSVRPYVVTRRAKNRTQAGMTGVYEFVNVGLGPAVVRRFEFLVDRKPLTGGMSLEAADEVLARTIGGAIEYQVVRSACPSPGYCLRAGEEYLLAEVSFKGITKDLEKELDRRLQVVDVELEYEDFYGRKFTLSTREGAEDKR